MDNEVYVCKDCVLNCKLTQNSEMDAERLNERTKRNIEINSNGVWLLNYQPCTKCGGQLMYGGRADEPKIFCPQCGTRFVEEK